MVGRQPCVCLCEIGRMFRQLKQEKVPLTQGEERRSGGKVLPAPVLPVCMSAPGLGRQKSATGKKARQEGLQGMYVGKAQAVKSPPSVVPM